MPLSANKAVKLSLEGVPLTLTIPSPCPIKPSDVHSISHRQMQSPIFCTTCSEAVREIGVNDT
jgi:hypothetical protein